MTPIEGMYRVKVNGRQVAHDLAFPMAVARMRREFDKKADRVEIERQ